MKSIFLILACVVALAVSAPRGGDYGHSHDGDHEHAHDGHHGHGHDGKPNGAAAFAQLTHEEKMCLVEKFHTDGKAINVSNVCKSKQNHR